MNKGLIVALALSLGANVFLGGFVAGRLAGPRMHGAPFGSGVIDTAPAEFAQMSAEARREFRRVFAEERRAIRDDWRAGAEIRREFVEALGADAFDRAAAEAAADKLAAFEGERRAKAGRVLVDVAAKLSPEDRKAFAAALAARQERRGRRGDGPPPES